MRSFLRKIFDTQTPHQEAQTPRSPEKEDRTFTRIETTESMQRDDARGEVSLLHNHIEYALLKDPNKERGHDSVLADEETGLYGVADGISASTQFGEYAPAEASLEALQQLPRQFKTMLSESALIPVDDIQHMLTREQQALEEKYGTGPLGTFAEQAHSLQKLVTKRTIDTTLTYLFSLTRAIDRLEESMDSHGLTTLSVGKTIPLQDGRQIALYALVGDSYIMTEDQKKRITDMVPPQNWAHYLETHPDEGPQAPAMRQQQAKKPTESVGRGAPRRRSKGDPLRHMTHDVSIGVSVLQPGESLIFASDGIDALGDSLSDGIATARDEENMNKQNDDVSFVKSTVKAVASQQKAA